MRAGSEDQQIEVVAWANFSFVALIYVAMFGGERFYLRNPQLRAVPTGR